MANSPTKSRPVGNPREQWRGRLADMTTDEMTVSFASSLQRLGTRRRVPDSFRCPECFYLKATKRRQFLVWAQEHRPDIKGVLDCRCVAVTDELERRRRVRFDEANLPVRHDAIGPRTFGNFKHSAKVDEMVRAGLAFTEGKGSPLLVFIGVTGCGKSHVMEAAARKMLGKGHQVRYEVILDLLDRLRGTFDNHGEEGLGTVLASYKQYSALFLDELLQEGTTPWGAGYLTNLVDHRLAAGLPTMIATNIKSYEEMALKWNDKLASRIFDRHSGSVERVYCAAEDYRLHGGGK